MTVPNSVTTEQSVDLASGNEPRIDLSEYAIWYAAQRPSFVSNTFEGFIKQKTLDIRPSDPVNYPGLGHAVDLSRTNPASQEEVPIKIVNSIKVYVADKVAVHLSRDKFVKGNLINDRWTITGVLGDVQGFFNRGVLLVDDETRKGAECVMKLLPADAAYPGYATREIDILNRLSHHNIVTTYDSDEGQGPHDTPWIVTEYCTAFTLKTILKLFIGAKEMVPEMQVWQIFESLASAVQYCHHGPSNVTPGQSKAWDAVSHRDIIPTNVLLTYAPDPNFPGHPVTVKLADFGCAITASEMTARGFDVGDLPELDGDYTPPEGAVPSEATDIYQIGLIIFCFFSFRVDPDNERREESAQSWPGYEFHTAELSRLFCSCLVYHPAERPTVKDLVEDLVRTRKELVAQGKLDLPRVVVINR